MRDFKVLAYCMPQQDNVEALRFGRYLTHLAVTGFAVAADGNISVPGGFEPLLGLQEQGLDILPVVQNLVQGAFDGKLLAEILNNLRKRRRLVNNCVQLVQKYRCSGIHINFENYKGEAAVLTRFMHELYQELKGEATVSMALPAKTKETTWFEGYDYRGLSEVNDFALLMTYDLHWPGGEPGPVSSVPWMEQVVDNALSRGWKHKQLFLGVPLYGYDWPRHDRARVVLHSQVMSLLESKGIHSTWDRQHGESHFTYLKDGQKHQVWFQDTQSVGVKIALAKEKGLAGVGFWRLGFQFPGLWDVL